MLMIRCYVKMKTKEPFLSNYETFPAGVCFITGQILSCLNTFYFV